MNLPRSLYVFRFLILITTFYCSAYTLQAQYVVEIHSHDKKQKSVVSDLWAESKFNAIQADTNAVINSIHRFELYLKDRSYILSGVDSLQWNGDTCRAFVYLGESYQWKSLRNGNIDEYYLQQSGANILFKDEQVYVSRVKRIFEKLLSAYENNGYPFATIRVDSVQISDQKISAVLVSDPGTFYQIDSIVVKGNANISQRYVEYRLGIRDGDMYKENMIKQIPRRIKEVPFLNQSRDFSVRFTDRGSNIYLYLENKKASRIDGVIGFLPDANNNNKINVTGEVKLKLQNSFGQGELLDVNWRQPLPKTQDLKVRFNYPFLISYFGTDLFLSLYKKDSTYLEVNRSASVDYLISARQNLRGTFHYKTSSLISVKQYANAVVLPPNADFTLSRYLLSYFHEQLDYRLNPRKGFSLQVEAGAGNRKLIKNSGLNELLYDSLDLKEAQVSGSFHGAMYFPLGSRSAVKVGLQTEWMLGDNLFENELIRFGGLQTLRGFDEESILASIFVLPLLEYRLILDENSYMALFGNMAWYERESTEFITDTPFGFGAGINFETKLGIFSFNYALGKEFDNSIDFRNGKIHFGLVNYF